MRTTVNNCLGLMSGVNPGSVPLGALKQSIGMYVRGAGLLEQTRPLVHYSFNLGQTIAALAYYKQRLIANTSAGYYVESAFYSRTFAAVTAPTNTDNPDTTDTKYLRYVEANGNLYLSAKAGFLKFDTAGANPYMVGIPRALDVQLSLVASGTLLASTNSAGYRVCFAFLDANNNLIIGPPSGRAVITATGAQNVSVKAWIPKSVYLAANATSYFVQVYRTPVQTVSGVDPGEEMQLVYQAYLTSTDVSNKYISFTDFTPDDLRETQGYFTPSQEGLAEANYPPPIAYDVTLFKGTTYYANTTSKHRLRVQMLGITANTLTISTGAGGITKSGGSGIITLTGSPDLTNIPTDGTAKVSITASTTPANNGEFPITAVDNVGKTITYTNASAATEPGTASSRAFPSKLTINSVNYYGSLNGTETPASQIYSVVSSGTASQNVRDTCVSLLRVVNQQASPTVYGYYESGPDDGAGKMLFEEVGIGGSQFNISAAGTLWYNSFNPTIPAAAPWKSQNDAAVNRLYYSKVGQPEHVPLGNYEDIGAGSKKILRIVALREALLIFKEDGLFRLTGDGAGNFAISAMDPYLIAISKTGITTSNNKAYALAASGFAEITETAVNYVSDAVSDQFRMITDQALPISLTVYAWANDIDRTVGIHVGTGGTGSASVCLLYCTKTGTWASLPSSELGQDAIYGAGVIRVNGMPFRPVGQDIWADDGYLKLAASITVSDSANKPLPGHKVHFVVSGHTATTITYDNTQTSVTNYGQPAVGTYLMDYQSDNPSVAKVTAVSVVGASTTLTVATALGTSSFNTGLPMYWLSPQSVTVEWMPFYGDGDAAFCRYREAAVMLVGAGTTTTTATMNAYTEATASTQILSMTSTNTPLPTGVSGQTLLRALVPLNMQTARRLSVVFQHSTAAEYVFIGGLSFEYDRLGASANEVA